MSRVYSKKKRACRWNDTPGPLYNAAPTHLLFGSTPHYTTLFSNVKPPLRMSPRLGSPRQLDLGFRFVLFSSGGARGIQESCQGGVPVTH